MRDIGWQHIVWAGGTNWKKKVYGVKLSKKHVVMGGGETSIYLPILNIHPQ